MATFLLPLVAALGTVEGTAGQERENRAVLQGTVVSAMTGGPLAGVKVSLSDGRRGAITDDSGAFVIPEVPAGSHEVRLRLLGFADETVSLRLVPSHVTRAVFLLSRTVLEVDDIEVTVAGTDSHDEISGFERRRAKGWGHFLTATEIEDRGPESTSDLFRAIPGFRVGASGPDGAPVRMARRSSVSHCRPSLYLDGAPKAGLRVDDVEWRDILAMEVYHGSAETPAQFEFRGGNCGTVVIWTRSGRSDS